MLKFAALLLLAILVAGAPPSQDDQLVQNYVEEATKFNSQYQMPLLSSSVDQQNEKNARFFLHTTQEPHPVELSINDDGASIKNSSYNVKYETIILNPCLKYNHQYFIELVSAYLRREHASSPYVNVIVVDYSHYTDMYSAPEFIGQQLATLSKLIHKYGTPYLKMHIIGHGVGAHIAGGAAKYIHPAKFDRITGLEPFGAKFDHDESLLQLRSDSAEFVDTVTAKETCMGSQIPRGHIRFEVVEREQSSCYERHQKVLFYYMEALLYPQNFKGINNETNAVAFMGEFISRSPSNKDGVYVMNVNGKPPYGESTKVGNNGENKRRYNRAPLRTGKW